MDSQRLMTSDWRADTWTELSSSNRLQQPSLGRCQASAAESYGLKQIAGVGYRKALEFLIKDYCTYTRPADEAEIRKVFLGECINRFVDDPKVKDCARRAVWLGNDETHYERKWADKDVGDLKTLINLTVLWIHSCELTKQYLAEMPERRRACPQYPRRHAGRTWQNPQAVVI
jgi:hypothetical protein